MPELLKQRLSFSRWYLAVFMLVFAALGGYTIWRSFAAPAVNVAFGDLNGDGTVSVADLSLLLSNFGTSAAAADINSDSAVNIFDLSIMLSRWGQSVPTQPPPPPPPPPPPGTVVPGAFFVSPSGSDSNNGAQSSPWKTLGKAMSTLSAGQTAYLRAGTYEEAISGSCGTSFNTLTWNRSGSSSAPITILGYPGEENQAIVKARIQMEGSWQKLANMVIEHNNAYDGDTGVCVGSRAIGIGGADDEVSGLEIRNIDETGILFHSTALRVKAFRNYIHDVGRENTNQDHGFYVQGSGHLIANNVIVRPRGGYGIHLYSSPSNVIVAQNTVIGSVVRSGIIIDTTGTNITVVNNITANNVNYGILARQCASGCVYNNNLAYGNGSGATSGSGITNTFTGNPLFVNASADNYRLQSGSPAIDAAVASYSYTPDLDNITRPVGTGPDLGAFER